MIHRILTSSRHFSSFKQRKTLTAIIGNQAKVPELIKTYRLERFMNPVFFNNEEEMMKPGNYDSALIVNSNPKQMEKFLEVQKSIKWIHSTMAGVDWVLNDRLKNSNIVLTNAKGAFSYSLAEFVLFGILYFCKKTPHFIATKAKKQWEPIDVDFALKPKVGIIGYGNIGYTTAKLLKKSLGAEIYGCCNKMSDVPKKQREICTKLYDAETRMEKVMKVISSSDFVVGILPKTKNTLNFFDLEKFKKMKETGVFINIGRGVTMVENDLVTALKEKRIAGAVLDVFPQEPLPSTSELYDIPNILMTYHCADRTIDYWERTMKVFKNELKLYTSGKPPKNLISKVNGY